MDYWVKILQMLKKLQNCTIINLMDNLVKMSQKCKIINLRNYWFKILHILQNVKLLIWGIIGLKFFKFYKM